jgi:NAD(P)-dependent dehydrogenase (short-subunit alcohol dehydrogenase family)
MSLATVPDRMPVVTDGKPSARRFLDRVCLITGAGGGIGRATALRLAAEGAVIIASDIDLQGAGETLAQAGGAGLALALDVRSAESVGQAVREAEARFAALDVLVNNAGIEILGNVAQTDPVAWDEVMSVNLRGTYLVSRALLPMLLRRAGERGSAIVNNASLMGLVSSPGLAAYCAAKAGVISLTRSMALDHAEQGLRVNCVCPGIIHTEMLERRFALEPDRATAYRLMLQRPPVRYFGRPEDVAAMIAYLASDEARFVTGSAHVIDGGVGAA